MRCSDPAFRRDAAFRSDASGKCEKAGEKCRLAMQEGIWPDFTGTASSPDVINYAQSRLSIGFTRNIVTIQLLG